MRCICGEQQPVQGVGAFMYPQSERTWRSRCPCLNINFPRSAQEAQHRFVYPSAYIPTTFLRPCRRRHRFRMAPLTCLLCVFAAAGTALASPLILARQNNSSPTSCPGYRASNVQTSANGLTATLTLAGSPCNVYGTDIEDLTLTVEHQTGIFIPQRSLKTKLKSIQTNASTS